LDPLPPIAELPDIALVPVELCEPPTSPTSRRSELPPQLQTISAQPSESVEFAKNPDEIFIWTDESILAQIDSTVPVIEEMRHRVVLSA
jgi:hypothetical protein